jgi:glyoxylase-like metal-dependent hydrolase (beta-lactamase superfamily II)
MMLKTSIFTFVTAAAVFGCEGDQGPAGPAGPPGGDVDPAAPAIDKAFFGAGGRDAVSDLKSFRITASGERLFTLEGYAPEDDSIAGSTFDSDTASDVTGERLRIGYKRKLFIFGAMNDYRIIINKDVGATDGVESVFGTPGGALTSDRVASTTRQHRLLNPQLILRDIAQGKLQATDRGLALRDGELRHRIDVNESTRPVSLFVDRYTGELTDLATSENDWVTGDVTLEVHYAGWKSWDDSGVRFPADVLLAINNQAVHVERRSAVSVNAALEASLFAFPTGVSPQPAVAADAARGARNSQFHESFAGLGVPLDGLQTFVMAETLAPGVHHLRGGSHNSLVVEQQNGVVVIEAPLYEARAQAIYTWITQNIPGKTVTHVVATHHHRDHVGALRTFVARGAKVVVGEPAKPFFANAFRASRTIEPDELSAMPKPAVIETVPVGGELTIGATGETRPVRVVHTLSTHAADMVITYTPTTTQGVVFVSDIYSPGLPGGNPAGAREVRDAIVGKSLTVDKIAGGHGTTGTRAELDALANM